MAFQAIPFPNPSCVLLAVAEGATLGGLMMAAGVMLLTIWALAKTRKRLMARVSRSSSTTKRSRNPHAPERTSIDRLEQFSRNQSDRDEIESLMVDAEELTRRLAAQLDNKAARMERLIADADQRLARLQEATSHARPPTASGLDHVAPPAEDPLTREAHHLADQGLSPIEIAQQLSEQVGKIELILALRETQPRDQSSTVSK